MSAKSNLVVTNKSDDSGKSDDSIYDWWYDYGEFAGDAFNEVKDYLSSFWNDMKRAGSNFADGFSRKTSGKSFAQNMDAFNDRVTEGKEKAKLFLKNHDVHSEESGKDTTTPQSGTVAKPIVYSDWSPAAHQFGMDQNTAYAEHMANTSHQREVADLKAAGLNPVLGISGSGASGVSGSVASGAIGASSAQKGINSDALVDVIGATAGLLVTILTKKPALGAAAGKAAQAGGNLFFGD